MSTKETPLLEVRNLKTHFDTEQGMVYAVDGVSFDVYPGETLGIVGESGSGKTVSSESITRLFDIPPGEIVEGEILFDGEDITQMSEAELRQLRGGRIGHIFQNPQGSLNPVYTVGWQIREAIQLHQDVTNEVAKQKAIELLEKVGIPEAASRVDDYPHQFSGGMKQRVIIAIALACEPDLLIADEPTTALDVTIQAQILRLLRKLQDELGMSIIFITHDLGVIAEVCDRVVVMYSGKVMERADVYDLFEETAHPYTRALLECLPGQGSPGGIPGQLPDVMNPPQGCRFHQRCPYAIDECRTGEQPDFQTVGDNPDHLVSCVHYRDDMDPSILDQEAPEVGYAKRGRTDGGESP